MTDADGGKPQGVQVRPGVFLFHGLLVYAPPTMSQIPAPKRVKKPSQGRSVTLKGNLANLFVKAHDRPPETDQEVLERVALAIHMHMATNNIEKAVLVLKSFRNSPPIPNKPQEPVG